MRVWEMRTGIIIDLNAADRARLKAIAADRNSPQKHFWRTRIVLLTADGIGTNEIRRETGVSKTCVWRWQEWFMNEGVDGLLCAAERRDRGEHRLRDLGETTGRNGPLWTAPAMAKAIGVSVSPRYSVSGAGMVFSPIASASLNCPTTSDLLKHFVMWSGFMSIRPLMRWCFPSTRNPKSRRWTAPNRGCL